MNLNSIIEERKILFEKEKKMYLTCINQINSNMKELLTNNLGEQFLKGCGQDLCGELVRNYFDTSDFYITVDQMYRRIKNFNYKNDYDPLKENTELKKNVYNYNDSETSEQIKMIIQTLDESKEKLFKKDDSKKYIDNNLIKNKKEEYRQNRKSNNNMYDDYTGGEETFKENKNGVKVSQLDVEHTQALSTAYIETKYLKEDGIIKLKEFFNSQDNFAMMNKPANQSKGDVKVFDEFGNDITYKATPEQITNAVIERWENCKSKEKLIDQGILDKNGKVNPYAKKKLLNNLRISQNKESKIILEQSDYAKIAKDSAKYTAISLKKILAGQIIYYMLPPILYEIKGFLKNRKNDLDTTFEKLIKAKDRICKYVLSKLKSIIENTIFNSIKKFVKSFFDIIINLVKASIKKMFKFAKSLVLAVIDSIKIVMNKNSTPAQKADSTFNLISITITNFVVEAIFELLQGQFSIIEPFLLPLQMIVTIICSNLVMLILNKMDLFDVRYGLLVTNIESLFDKENKLYIEGLKNLEYESNEKINKIIEKVKVDLIDVKEHLNNLNIYSDNVEVDLQKINEIFNMNIDFNNEWNKYIGIES